MNIWHRPVSMHLLVLSAFRLSKQRVENDSPYVSMHLLVLSAFRHCPRNHCGASFGPVSMHLLVLSAFRRKGRGAAPCSLPASQCTFWCSVLSDGVASRCVRTSSRSQCTFWCSVLSDTTGTSSPKAAEVSMHLLVLSAFRPRWISTVKIGLIASQCTFWCSVLSDPSCAHSSPRSVRVSMHLLVLSAFRQEIWRGDLD